MSPAEAIAEGRRRIEDVAPFLNGERNVLLADGRILTCEEMTRVLLSFSALSRALPDILTFAARSCDESSPKALRDEIALNLAEELGEIEALPGGEGLSHYAILRSEVQALLDVDPEEEPLPAEGADLIRGLHNVIGRGNATAYGALLALETTAIPEILIIKAAVERFSREERIQLSPRLVAFFDAHTAQFEAEHAARLCALHPIVNRAPGAQEEIDAGFDRVIKLMRRWWYQMLGSTYLKS